MKSFRNISKRISSPQRHGLLRASLAMFLVMILGIFSACTFPVRTGYDRKIGDYKPIPQATQAAPKQSSSETVATPAKKSGEQVAQAPEKAATKQRENPATQPAPKKSTAPAAKQATPASSKKYSSLKEYTESWRGTKYVYGGSSKSGTDCSGYIMNIYRDMYGVSLPHKASMIYDDERFTKVSRGDLKEGDLIFFGDFWGISHIGIFLGDDIFSHASTSRGVVTDKLSANYYDSRYKGARRLKK